MHQKSTTEKNIATVGNPTNQTERQSFVLLSSQQYHNWFLKNIFVKKDIDRGWPKNSKNKTDIKFKTVKRLLGLRKINDE